MPTADGDPPDTIGGVGKQQPKGGRHKTPRVNVGVPEVWHAVLRRIAAKRQQPVLYAIISLVQQEAERLGLGGIPPPPWGDDKAG